MHLFVASSELYKRSPESTTFTLLALPAGVTKHTNRRPCFAKYRRRTIVNGCFNPGIVWDDENSTHWKIGIQKPTTDPTVAVLGTGITASVIMYYSWVHKIGGVVIHQGNISNGAAITLVNQGVRTTVPATALDARTTHVRLWASVDGALPRFVSDSVIGTTSLDWNGPVAAIVNAETPPVNSDGSLNTDARGVPPYGRFCGIFHNRAWYQDVAKPARVWFSLIDEPESVGPTAYRDTKDREAVTGFGVYGDQFLVGCHSCFYDIQGYAEADFVMNKIDHRVGCISHWSIVYCSDRALRVAAQDGVYRFRGRFEYEFTKRRREWLEAYKADKASYENCVARDSIRNHAYELLIPQPSAFYYIGQYAVKDETGAPAWVDKRRARKDYALGVLINSLSDQFLEDFTGSCDGHVRQENVDSNSDDDGDTYQKKCKVRPGHRFFGDQSGGHPHGKAIDDITLYIKSENQGYTLSAYGGSDQARSAAAPTWGPYSFAALLQAGAVPETSKLIKPSGLAGKGVTLELTVTAPVGFEYRGYSVNHGAGPESRNTT